MPYYYFMKKSSVRLLPTIAYIFSSIVIVYIALYFFAYKPIANKYSIFNTLPILDATKMSQGYTLIAPYNRALTLDPKWKGQVLLLDLFGKPVHTWQTNHQVLYSVLEPNGNLLAVMESPKYSTFVPPGGNTGIIQELDWNSKVVWEYKDEMMHHDIIPLKNGNVVVALWEKTPENIASQIQGGAQDSEIDKTVWSDKLVEINKKGQTVWTWHSYEHLDPSIETLDPLMPKYAWTYTNGLAYMEHNPIDGTEGYLISMRSLSAVFIVRKSDGQILWRSPKGMLNTQHDPTILSNGNIMVFDNELTRAPHPFPTYGSRVAEINPKTNMIVWEFYGGKGAIDKARFFSPIVGGAQRLSNGNTLVTDGVRGHIFEVTKDQKIVWDLDSPYTTQLTGAFPNNFLFKSRRYTENEIKWPEKIAPPFDTFKYQTYQLLKNIYPL